MSDARFEVREIEHTADWAIRVRAPSLAELFAGAATGMFGLLSPLDEIRPADRFNFHLQAVDPETLLVDWLNELLYEADARHALFAKFDITRLDRGTAAGGAAAPAAGGAAAPAGGVAALAGTAWSGPATPSKAIKAATFSGLRIMQDETGYTVDVVFDV